MVKVSITLKSLKDGSSNLVHVSQPHFGLSVKIKLTFPKVGTWSPSGLSKAQSLIAGVFDLSHLGFLYTVGKVLKCRCPKMALHEPFGHLQLKLWAKERSGVKLPV